MPARVDAANSKHRPALIGARTRKFLSYYRPYRRLLAADLACALLGAAATLALPVCANIVTKTMLADPGSAGGIYSIGAIMVALVAVQAFCTVVVDYHGHMMGARMERDMRRDLFDHYQKLSFAFYDRHRTGQLMSRITHDVFDLSELYHHGPEDLTVAVATFVGVLMILFHIDVTLTLLVLAFLPFMAAYAFHFNRRMNRALRLSRQRVGDINERVEDSLAGIRVVKSFTNEALETGRFDRENERFLESRRAGYRAEAWFHGGMGAMTQLITISVIVIGAAGITQASLDLADVLTFLLCVAILIEPIRRLVNVARLCNEGFTGFERFMEMLEIQPDIADSSEAVDFGPVRGAIAFRDVSFRYQDNAPHVMRGLSLDIRPGEFVALVGASGVGKTTLCALIPRFYEASEGAVLIDGVDVKRIRLASLRKAIGIVQQDVYLFAGTVAENLRYGRPSATDEEIVAAAIHANAHAFIAALPNGYATDIGQRGVKLSGGQKQRLSIARAFLKDPPILIFDEATSALDGESERAVQSALERLARGRTMIVIAHRLSTVRNASRILVLTGDGIAEQGTHDELLAQGGTYARLYDRQASL
jgi:ATP-binding cassette subfamily B protein